VASGTATSAGLKECLTLLFQVKVAAIGIAGAQLRIRRLTLLRKLFALLHQQVQSVAVSPSFIGRHSPPPWVL